MIALIIGMLTKNRNHLSFGHSPQTLTTGVVRMLYFRDMKHIYNKLWCDNNARTSNASMKGRYWRINFMHVGVKILDQYRRTNNRDVTQWLPTPIVNDSGYVNVGEIRQNDSVFRMNTSSRKFLWEVLSSILIMEPNRRGGRIKRQRCPRMKRVSRRSKLTFWCHDVLT